MYYIHLVTCNFRGSMSFAISCFLISAMVLGPFLSGLEAKPWVDRSSSKSSSFTFGLGPTVKQQHRLRVKSETCQWEAFLQQKNLKSFPQASLTKSRPADPSFLPPTNDTRKVEVVVGFRGLCACRLRCWRWFRCWSRSRHPRFGLSCGRSSWLPGLGLRRRRGRGGGRRRLCAEWSPWKVTTWRACKKKNKYHTYFGKLRDSSWCFSTCWGHCLLNQHATL